MAPEQAEGQTLDQRADLFSLGSVLYQMVAGRPPFRANGTVAVLKRVAEDRPRAIREIIPETPQWLCDVIARLHAKDPDDRYQSAREVADVLADCEAQLKANARLKDYSRIPRSKPRRFGRQKWVAAALAVLLLGGLALGIYGLVSGSRSASVTVRASEPDLVVSIDGKLVSLSHVSSGVSKFTHSVGVPLSPGEHHLKVFKDAKAVYEQTFTLASGERKEIDIPKPDVDGWVQLINGKDLNGWKTHPDQPGDWRIDSQGILVGSGTTSHLFTQRGDFANFQLRAEVKINDGGGGGVYVRVPAIELPRGGVYPVGLKATTGTGSDIPIGSICRALSPDADVAAEYVLSRRPPPRPGEWFTLDVLANQGSITVKINGATTAEFSRLGPEFLRGHIALQAHQAGTVIEFRKIEIKELPPGKPDAPPPAIAPFTDADVHRIATLPAALQVEEVRKELMRRNPGFNGKTEHKIQDGVVTEFRIVTDKVTDIAPIRVWSALRVLECRGTYTDNPNGLLANLTPFERMNLAGLRHLNLINTKVSDAGMVYLKDCKDLKYLNLFNTKVTEAGMVYLKNCKALTHLNLAGTNVSDPGLAHFKGMPLMMLWIQNTGITDLTPLQGMPLEDIRMTPKNITKGLDILRDMKSLKTIGIDWNQVWPAAEFWQRYDKGEFK
jgi:hypothetical protein